MESILLRIFNSSDLFERLFGTGRSVLIIIGESKFSQCTRTLLSIPTDFGHDIVWVVSILPCVSNYLNVLAVPWDWTKCAKDDM